jgi:adenine phosphoribosyltransferase
MAIPFLTALSMRSGVPFLIIRKRSYGLEGEVVVDQSTGYSKGALYINSLPVNSNVLVLDDVISTGGTLSAILRGLFKCNVNVKQIVTIVNKCNGSNIVSNEFNIPLLSLVDMDIVDGVVVCSSNV